VQRFENDQNNLDLRKKSFGNRTDKSSSPTRKKAESITQMIKTVDSEDKVFSLARSNNPNSIQDPNDFLRYTDVIDNKILNRAFDPRTTDIDNPSIPDNQSQKNQYYQDLEKLYKFPSLKQLATD